MGNGRPDEPITPGQDSLHHTLAVFHGDLHQIAGEGAVAALAQTAPTPAGYDACGGLDIVKSTDGIKNASFLSISHYTKSMYSSQVSISSTTMAYLIVPLPF